MAGLLTRDPARRTGLSEMRASAWLSLSLKRLEQDDPPPQSDEGERRERRGR